MCTFEIDAIVALATLPAKHEFLSSQRIFHPLLILQVVSTSLKLRLLLASLRCRRCLLTPCNEISMWKKCSGTPSMEAQYKTSIWKNAIIPHMEAQYKTSIWKNAIIPHMEAQYKTRV